jgi:tyrosyl-tRNA synthetase
MINAGAVKIDGEKVENSKLDIAVGSQHVYQVGKRKFARVKITNT